MRPSGKRAPVGDRERRDLHQEVPPALASDDERGLGLERLGPRLLRPGGGTLGLAPLSVGARAAALIVAVAGVRAQPFWQRLLAVLAEPHALIVPRRAAQFLLVDSGR
jgi:hypothetical protein